MFTPTAAPARALTKSSPYNGPRGQPGPHETNPTAASSRNTGSRASSRDPTNTSGAAQRASDGRGGGGGGGGGRRNSGSQDRKSTRLNSSHSQISYAVFCLKKKKKDKIDECDRE